MTRGADWPVILTTLGAAGLARAALGIEPYPFGDDLIYGPLARKAADPSLYPGDAQLDAFVNHAQAYSWIWRAADATLGVAPVFLVLTLAITAGTALAMLSIMRAVGARGALTPLAVLLAGVVTLRGVGRGDYGGIFTDHFHHQGVAILLALFAFAALLRERAALCGLLLGLAALFHPALALHAAFAVGCGWLLTAGGLRGLFITAGVSALVAAPVVAPILLASAETQATWSVERVIRDGYFFRAAHHYQLGVDQMLVLALYLLAAMMGARMLGRRAAAGLALAFALMALTICAFYLRAFDHPLRYVSVWVYVLDFTRSTPLLWALGAALGCAALERADRADRVGWLMLFLPLGMIFIVNFQWSLWSVVALAFASALAAGPLIARFAGVAALAGGMATALVAARTPLPAPPEAPTGRLVPWLLANTAPHETIIAPPALSNLREQARRPVWADFRAFSMSQPGQIQLSRERLEAITPHFGRAEGVGGKDAARAWSLLYAFWNRPEQIAAHLRDKGDVFVTFAETRFSDEEVAAAGLSRVHDGPRFHVFRLAR